jgi:hypothetical protein
VSDLVTALDCPGPFKAQHTHSTGQGLLQAYSCMLFLSL